MKSLSVRPPAAWVVRVTATRPQPSSMSGWWPSASASRARRATKPKASRKLRNSSSRRSRRVSSRTQEGSSWASYSEALSSEIVGVPGLQARQWRLASSSLIGPSSLRIRAGHKLGISAGDLSGTAGTLAGMSDVLRARGLLKTYRRGRAVDGVDLTMRRGERVALLGPNGAGKTTTLLMCLGVVEPDGGTIEIAGHRLPGGRSAAMAHVGFAAGYLPLPERLRVGEYLRMFGQLYGLADPEAQALRGLERFGVSHLVKAMGTELSSGQKTLIGIVKSTMHDPELLVLDEPTASLDPDAARPVRGAGHGPAGHQPQHGRGGADRRAGRVPVRRPGGRRRPAARGRRPVRARRPGGGLPPPGLRAPGQRAHRGAAAMTAQGSEAAAARGPVRVSRELAPWLRVLAVARRHVYVLYRSPHRLFDVTVWPIVDTVLFGSLGVFFVHQGGPGSPAQAGVASLLSGIVLWHVVYQAQIAVSTGFMEETWSRNLLSLMVTPLRELELVAGIALFGLAKLAMGVGVVALAAFGLYAFDVTSLGLGLLPVIAILLLNGWAIALVVVGLMLRFGNGAEALAWGLMFVIMPLGGVFYPIEALPAIVRPISALLPTTHAFAAGRELIDGGPVPWGELTLAAVGTLAFVVAALAFVAWMLRLFRRRGYVTRYS